MEQERMRAEEPMKGMIHSETKYSFVFKDENVSEADGSGTTRGLHHQERESRKSGGNPAEGQRSR